MKTKKVKIFKLLMLILVIMLLVMLTTKMMPLFKNISTNEGRIEFKSQIESFGIKGIFIILGLMFAQVFLVILPGEPVEVLAGMCYGPIGGLFVIYLGAFLSSLFVFFMVRKFGKDFIYSFVEKEKIEKIEKSKWFSNTKKIDRILFILFFIPGTPKDLFVYVGGLLPINPIKFLAISTFARFPSIISSTIAGSNIIDGNWGIIAGVYAITFIISLLIFWIVKRKDKDIAL